MTEGGRKGKQAGHEPDPLYISRKRAHMRVEDRGGAKTGDARAGKMLANVIIISKIGSRISVIAIKVWDRRESRFQVVKSRQTAGGSPLLLVRLGDWPILDWFQQRHFLGADRGLQCHGASCCMGAWTVRHTTDLEGFDEPSCSDSHRNRGPPIKRISTMQR